MVIITPFFSVFSLEIDLLLGRNVGDVIPQERGLQLTTLLTPQVDEYIVLACKYRVATRAGVNGPVNSIQVFSVAR
jgi:hypothetical protein